MKVPELNKSTEIIKEKKPDVKPTETTVTTSSDADLLQMLKQQTEQKPDPNKIKEAAKVKEPGATPENKEETVKQPEPGHFRPPGVEPIATPTAPTLSYAAQAELLIAFVDGIDCLIMPWGYQQSIFSREERKRLRQIKTIKESKSLKAFQELSEADKNLLERYNDYKELVEAIPFTNSEIEMTKIPLAAVMEKYKTNLGPEMLLMGAMFTLMAPRLMPMFNKFERL